MLALFGPVAEVTAVLVGLGIGIGQAQQAQIQVQTPAVVKAAAEVSSGTVEPLSGSGLGLPAVESAAAPGSPEQGAGGGTGGTGVLECDRVELFTIFGQGGEEDSGGDGADGAREGGLPAQRGDEVHSVEAEAPAAASRGPDVSARGTRSRRKSQRTKNGTRAVTGAGATSCSKGGGAGCVGALQPRVTAADSCDDAGEKRSPSSRAGGPAPLASELPRPPEAAAAACPAPQFKSLDEYVAFLNFVVAHDPTPQVERMVTEELARVRRELSVLHSRP